MSLNKVQLIGNVGADPEIRRTQDGRPIANLRIATSQQWRDKDSGERKERTEWHTVVVFNEHVCKFVEQYVKKGHKVYVEGMLQTRKWQDQAGNDRYSTEVTIPAFGGELQSLEKPPSNRPPPAGGEEDYGRTSTKSERNSEGDRRDEGGGRREFSRDLDDDIPF